VHKFNPENIERLVSDEREQKLPPETFLRDHGLKEGMFFADIGCGPGFFSIPAAKIVGTAGTVYAVDMQKEMLDELRKRSASPNIIPCQSEENAIPIADKKADFTLLAYVLHEAIEKATFLRELKRITKTKGKVLVLDWEKKEEEMGPPFEERLEKGEAVRLMEEADFTIERVSSLSDGSHYCIDTQVS
jgi:ubiquinone/menaquinone biosynthesis C-methylase UbiE